MRALAAAAVLALPLAFPARAGAEDSIRCAGGIVAVGDATIDLLGKCGEPALREGRADLSSISWRQGPGAAAQTLAPAVERWTYDFGPRAFLMIVTLDGGKVTAVDRGGYGYREGEPAPVTLRRATCDPAVLRAGDAKLAVLSRCGEPTVAERRADLVRVVTEGVVRGVVVTRARTVVAEVWTYDFGPQVFVRFVSFEDGVVVKVETGRPGYAR